MSQAWWDLVHNLMRYLYSVVTDGDYANDWLTHLPEGLRYGMRLVGFMLAYVLGR